MAVNNDDFQQILEMVQSETFEEQYEKTDIKNKEKLLIYAFLSHSLYFMDLSASKYIEETHNEKISFSHIKDTLTKSTVQLTSMLQNLDSIEGNLFITIFSFVTLVINDILDMEEAVNMLNTIFMKYKITHTDIVAGIDMITIFYEDLLAYKKKERKIIIN